MKCGLIASLVFAFVALVLACVATGINSWYRLKLPAGAVYYFGLWKTCAKLPHIGTGCTSWNEFDSKKVEWLHACQAMMILSVVLYAAAIASILLHMVVLVHTRQLVKLAGILFIFGGLCNVVGLIVFATKYKDVTNQGSTGGNLYAGFGLAVGSAVFGFLSGIVAMSVKQDSYVSI